MEIRRVDPSDDAAIGDWHRIYVECGQYDAPETFVASPLSRMAANFRGEWDAFAYVAWLGLEDGTPVASGMTAAPTAPEQAEVLHLVARVLPQHRRKGHGSAMTAVLEEHALRARRALLVGGAGWEPSFGATGIGSQAVGFTQALGFSLGLVDVRRRLALPFRSGELDRLTTYAAERSAGYRLEAFSGAIPEDLIDDWAVLATAVEADAPTDDLEVMPAAVTPEQIRNDDQRFHASGERRYVGVAFDACGHAVASTDLFVRVGKPDPAKQNETIVLAAHRGHRLGLAVKLAALRLLQAERPDIRSAVTTNALSNAHMVAVNDLLGYAPVEYAGVFQKRLA